MFTGREKELGIIFREDIYYEFGKKAVYIKGEYYYYCDRSLSGNWSDIPGIWCR